MLGGFVVQRNTNVRRNWSYRKEVRIAILAASLAVPSACAEFTHLTRTNVAPGGSFETTLVDAKQRAIMTRHARLATVDSNGSITTKDTYTFCTEPSPDALSAIAASQGLSLSKEDIEIAINSALGEAAGSIGLRTQSIQLMRDAMYRLCEAKMSGFVDNLAFETLHRRFQSSMVAILAIEQLTGAVRPPAVVLGAEATSGSAELVAKYTDMTEKARAQHEAAQAETEAASQKLSEAEAKLKEEQDKASNPPTPEQETLLTELKEKVEAAKKEKSKREKVEKEKKDLFEASNKARLAALSGGGATEVAFEIESDLFSKKRSDATIQKVAETVGSIVENTLNLPFSRELCTTILVAAARGQLNERTAMGDSMMANELNVLVAKRNDAELKFAEAFAEVRNLQRELNLLSTIKTPTNVQKRQIDVLRQNITNAESDVLSKSKIYDLAQKQIDARMSRLASSDTQNIVQQCNSYLGATVDALKSQSESSGESTKARAAMLASFADAIQAQPNVITDSEKLETIERIVTLLTAENNDSGPMLQLLMEAPLDD